MKFKLFGTEIYLSFWFLAAVTIMLSIDKTGLILPTFLAVFLHESGHLFTMWILGVCPRKIKLIPAGVKVTKSFATGYKTDTLTALSGPLVNLVFCAVFHGVFLAFGDLFFEYFAAVNLGLGIFNLLPVKGLDGGVILQNFLCKFTDFYTAERLLKTVTFIAGFCLIIAAIFLIFTRHTNLSILIMGVYLIFVCTLGA